MLEGQFIFSSISLAAGVLALSLGLYVFWKSPYLMVAQAFIISMSLVAINAVTYFLLCNAPTYETALMFARTALFTSVLVSGSFLYLACYLPYERKDAWPLKNRNVFLAVTVLIAVIPAAMIDQVNGIDFDYWIGGSLAVIVWLAIMVCIVFFPVYMLTRISLTSTDKETRWQSTMLSFGVSIPVIYALVDVTTGSISSALPHVPAVGLLVSALIFSYAVLGHRLFLIEPVREDRIEAKLPIGGNRIIKGGHCDLVEGKKSDLAYRMLVSEVASGNQGLLITRMHPDLVREKYGLVKTPILWLSGQPGPDRVDPASLSILQHTIVDFLQKGTSSVILLDGLEYLVSENQMDKVLRLVYTIHDAVVISRSKFIVPIDPAILDPRHLALFEREFDVIKEDE